MTMQISQIHDVEFGQRAAYEMKGNSIFHTHFHHSNSLFHRTIRWQLDHEVTYAPCALGK